MLASARATPAAAISSVASRRSPARTVHQAATVTSSTDRASKVANAPRCRAGPLIANRAAAKNAARRPNSRPAVAHSSVVAPSMKNMDRIRAPARPPTLSASAPSGG